MQKEVHWIQVKIRCDGELAEALAEVLGRFVSNGVVIESVTRYNERTKEHEPTEEVFVYGFLGVDEHIEEKQQKLEEALWHMSQIAHIPKPIYTPIQDKNWMEAWKKHYHPIPIGDHLLIMPAWKEPKPEEKRIIIRINPAMAFGTGTHPSTQLCLRLLERHFQSGTQVIDVGCGSGILSIAALKMGADHVLAVDVDNQAVIASRENAEINDLQPAALETGKGSVEAILEGHFSIKNAPLVMVNILASIILQLFDQGLGLLVSEGGVLLLSGILEPQLPDVLSAANAAGFTLIDQLWDQDWVSLAMRMTSQ